MTSQNLPSRQERLERATSRRLASLRDAPLDAEDFLAALTARIPPVHSGRRGAARSWFRSTRAVAASLLVFGIVGVLLMNSSSSVVLASPQRLARVHEEVVSANGGHVIPVDSTAAASAAIKSLWPDAPAIPELPKEYVQYSCLHTLAQKRVVCVVLKVDDVPVTFAVASASDIKLPNGETFDLNGIPCRLEAFDGITMVMSKRDGRWVCLMGRLPLDRLKAIATSIHF